MSQSKPKFKKLASGLVINTTPPKKFNHVGNIERRNKEDEKFYSTRIKILRRDLQPILKPIVKKAYKNTNSKPLKILDIGCGDGLVLNTINEFRNKLPFKLELHGIDLDTKAIKKIRCKVKLTEGSATKLPFNDSSFDLVTSKDVIEHLNKKEVPKKLKEIVRILKPGGIFYCETPNPESCIAKIMNNDWWMYQVPDHLTLIPPKSMKKLLNQAEFINFRTYTRAETDEQFDEVSEILSKIPNSILNKQLKFMRYSLVKYYLHYLNRGSITCSISEK